MRLEDNGEWTYFHLGSQGRPEDEKPVYKK